MTPTILIKKWLQFAIENNIARAHAMCLSTVNANGIPSSRMILASQITYDGIIFFTDNRSPKIVDIETNNNVSSLFYWAAINRQVRITGKIYPLNDSIAELDFDSKNREQKIMISICHQSKAIKNTKELKMKFKSFLIKQGKTKPIERPFYWKGYLIKINEIEFFNGVERPNRRVLFHLDISNKWQCKHLQQ